MGICSALAVMMIGMSYFHSHKYLLPHQISHPISAIQPAIEQAEKWQADKGPAFGENALTFKSPSDQPIDFVIWPEAAIAGNYVRNKDLVADMADQIAEFHQQSGGNGQWLTGVLRSNGVNKIYNSALVFRADGTKAFYDKTHLVPFGEYVPWRFIPFIDAIAGPVDFQAGSSVLPITVPDIGLVLPLICYEAIFPALTGVPHKDLTYLSILRMMHGLAIHLALTSIWRKHVYCHQLWLAISAGCQYRHISSV